MSVNMNWSYVCQHICNQLLSNQSFIDHFNTFTTSDDKVRHCLSQPFVAKLLDQFLTITSSAKHQKYWEKAKEFRIEGNDWFRRKCFKEAVEEYNQAIIFSSIPDPKESDEANNELSLSLANRSAVFWHLRQYDNCLTDISNAIKYNYPLNANKLLLRKANCLAQKRRFADANRVLQELTPEDRDRYKSDNQFKDLFKLIDEKGDKNPTNCLNTTKPKTNLKFICNELMPNASQSLELCSTPSKGRHILAKHDIGLSDVLFMEKPFASVLLPQYYKSHCNHCYRKLEDKAVMPCLKCTQVRYCSEQCVNDSWIQYHNYECGLLDVMHDIGIAHLALRCLLVCGIEDAIRVSTSSLDSNLTPYKNNYHSVYALVDHLNDFPLEDSLNYSLVASLLLVLTKNLGLIENETKNYEILGGIVLKHILQLITNGHAISSTENIELSFDLCFEDIRIATAIYPTVSLMNHSCDPNVIAVYDNKLLIVRAAKPIAKGQEVMNCYGPHCKRMSTKDRKIALKEQYFFDCECKACENGTEDLSRALVCHECKDAIVFDNRTEEKAFCRNCKKIDFDIKSMLNEVKKGLNVLSDGSKLMDDSKPLEAKPKLLESFGILQNVLYSKNRSLGKVLDQLSRCYALLKQWSEAVQYCRQSVEIVGQVFGESSLEVTNELIKLSELEFEAFNENKSHEESLKGAKSCLITTSKAIKLLTNYLIPNDDNNPHNKQMSELEERLVFCDLFVKQFDRKV